MNWLTNLFNGNEEPRDEMPVARKIVANDLTEGIMDIGSNAGSQEWYDQTLKEAATYFQGLNIIPDDEDYVNFLASAYNDATGLDGWEIANQLWDADHKIDEDEIEASGIQPKTGQPCSCRPGQERDNCARCEGTGMVIDHKQIREMPLEEKASKKTAAYEMNEPAATTVEKDYQLAVEGMSNYNLAEMLTEHLMKGVENFNEEKTKQLEYVSKNRKEAENKLLKLIGDHTSKDWKKAFEKFEDADIRGKDVSDKDIRGKEFKPGKQNWEKEVKYKAPTDKQRIEMMKGIGREEDKKAIGDEKLLEEQRKEASLDKKASNPTHLYISEMFHVWSIYGARGNNGWSLGFEFPSKEEALELAQVISQKLGIPIKEKEASLKTAAPYKKYNPLSIGNWYEDTTPNGYTYQAKVFDEGSEFGINHGRVSKLQVRDPQKKEVVHYERGWDVGEELVDIWGPIVKELEALPIQASLNKKAFKVGDKLYYRGHPAVIKDISINPFSLDTNIIIDCEGRELPIDKKEWKELGDTPLVEDLVMKEEPVVETPKVEEKPIVLDHIEEVKPEDLPKPVAKKAEISSPWRVIKTKDGKEVIARVAPTKNIKESKEIR